MKKACTMMLLVAALPVCLAGERPRAMFGVVADETPLERNGVLVRAVRPGSPAEKLNLRPGDRIESLKDLPVNSRAELRKILRSSKPGESMELVYRAAADASPKRTTVVLGERPPQSSSSLPENPEDAVDGDRKFRPLALSPSIRRAMREKRRAVLERLAALPYGFNSAEVTELLQSIRHLARDANPNGSGWMPGEAGQVTLHFKDREGSMVLHGANKMLSLTVYDAAGAKVGEFPLNTPQECQAVPQNLIERLRRLR